ncbi:hypothetical protein JVU11DRAFT_10875 [Chiua virens]|nr:hypothetical protein JVU11DRAFT_10875 [Chiua virens]
MSMQTSQGRPTLFKTSIRDVGGGAATLYALNGGTRPRNPTVGDFLYDFSARTVSIYYTNEWKNVTISQINSRVFHPEGPKSMVAITTNALLYWMPSNQNNGRPPNRFDDIEALLKRFEDCVCSSEINVKIMEVVEVTAQEGLERPKRNAIEENFLEDSERNDRQSKRQRQTGRLDKEFESSRFLSSVGIPEGTGIVGWDAGFKTYLPFAGKGCLEDRETLLVTKLAQSRSSERSGSENCGPEPGSFAVRDLVVELELDPVLKNAGEYDEERVQSTWTQFTNQIRSLLRESTSVVVRGWTPEPRMTLSKKNLFNLFGDLGQRCQWLEGRLVASNRESEKIVDPHQTTTLKDFVDLMDSPQVCGNFLDSKDINPSRPWWIDPLIDSTTAWNQTLYLRLTQTSNKRNEPRLNVATQGPFFIPAATWSSQGWRLVTHPGFVTFPHHDCCGLCTYIVGNSGAKIWGIIRPKRNLCPTSCENLKTAFDQAAWPSQGKFFSNADVATVCLEEGDVMFQPPGVLHTVYTPVPSIFTGGYFFSYETLHLTRAVSSLLPVQHDESLTNDERPGFMRTLCRMLIALRYRSEPRKLGKRSLLSLLIMIIDWNRNQNIINRGNGNPTLLEARGEVTYASQCAQSILRWMKVDVDQARNYVDKSGPYYSGGEETIVLPAVPKNGKDPLFPSLGVL